MKVAFVEFGAHAAAVPPDHLPIALTPAAEVALERLGREFDHPGAYLDEAAVEREGLGHFQTVETLSGTLDGLFAEHVAEVRAWELRPVRWHFMPLKVIYDGLWLRALEVRRTLEELRPSQVLYFRPPEAPYDLAEFPRSASLYARVLDVILPLIGVGGRCLDMPAEPEPSSGWPPLARRIAREVLRRSRKAAARSTGHGVPVLCLDLNYSIPAIAQELRQLGAAPVPWPATRTSAPRAVPVDEVWRAVEREPAVRGALVWDGLDLWPALSPWIRKLVDEGLRSVVRHDEEARAVLESVRPAAVLCSIAAQAREKTICHAAGRAGIPSIVSRHGELGTRDVRMVAYQDIDVVDCALCWGSWEEAWTRKRAPQVRTVVVGSPMIELAARNAPSRTAIRERLGLRLDGRVALYAMTALSGNDWYASGRAPRDSAYFRQEQALLRGLFEIEELHVVVKVHASALDLPLEEWCRTHAPAGRVSVIRQPNFAQLIHLADVVILDAPSTTLAQAVFGSAHINIVDNPVFRWERGVREHLERHGVIFSTAEAASRRIKESFGSGVLDRPAAYGPEARAPLVAGGPGDAARRAAEAVLAIATDRARDLRSVAG